MAKVESIVDPSFKTGMSKKGKWTLIKIMADGKTATGFGPISVGDEVDLEYNNEYQNWSFKKIGPQEIPSVQANADLGNDAMKLLELIYDDTQKILSFVEGDIGKVHKTTLPKSLKENWDEATTPPPQ